MSVRPHVEKARIIRSREITNLLWCATLRWPSPYISRDGAFCSRTCQSATSPISLTKVLAEAIRVAGDGPADKSGHTHVALVVGCMVPAAASCLQPCLLNQWRGPRDADWPGGSCKSIWWGHPSRLFTRCLRPKFREATLGEELACSVCDLRHGVCLTCSLGCSPTSAGGAGFGLALVQILPVAPLLIDGFPAFSACALSGRTSLVDWWIVDACLLALTPERRFICSGPSRMHTAVCAFPGFQVLAVFPLSFLVYGPRHLRPVKSKAAPWSMIDFNPAHSPSLNFGHWGAGRSDLRLTEMS